VVAEKALVGRGRARRAGRPDREQGQRPECEKKAGRALPVRKRSVAHDGCSFLIETRAAGGPIDRPRGVASVAEFYGDGWSLAKKISRRLRLSFDEGAAAG
jgi:hypothetical protein